MSKTIHIHLHAAKVKDASKYEARIRKQGDNFYALVVRIDKDGEENVLHGYKGKFFKTREAAEKSTREYIAKINTGDFKAKDASEQISLSKILTKYPTLKAYGLSQVSYHNGDVRTVSAYDIPREEMQALEAFVKSIKTVKDKTNNKTNDIYTQGEYNEQLDLQKRLISAIQKSVNFEETQRMKSRLEKVKAQIKKIQQVGYSY